MTTILLVEDDRELADVISRELKAENYQVNRVYTGQAALDALSTLPMDIIILDWMLPDIDGLSVLKEIRRASFLPVLMLTARHDEVDRVIGLELGADDYLTKPFDIRELIARVRAMLRRVEHTRLLIQSDQQQDKIIQIDSLVLNPQTWQAVFKNTPLELSVTEFKLLYLLVKNPGRPFTRRYLMSLIWEEEYFPGDRSVDNTILRLRKKMGDMGNCITTVRGMGYCFIRP